MSDIGTDSWGPSQASGNRESDCPDPLPARSGPAGQFGVWERSLNSQDDVVVCVVAAH